MIVSTEKTRLSHLVKSEYKPELAYCREVLVANDGTKTLEIGTVLGLVTATGKYKVATEAAVDGSKVAAAVVVEAVTLNGDTKVLALVRGPVSLSKGALVLDASYNDATKKGAVYAALEAAGMQLLETI